MKIKSWAPGKVIIAGEHFVVHGSYAIAAAIDKGINCEVTSSYSGDAEIVSPKLNLSAKLRDKQVPNKLLPVVEALRSTLSYLNERRAKFRLVIDPELPPSSGLGSSSATAVASVLALSSFLGHHLAKEELFELAMVSERIVHGNPSGVDVAVATHGGIIAFKKGVPPRHIRPRIPLDLVIAYSGLERSTAKMISKVAEVRDKHNALFDSLVNSSSKLIQIAISCLERGDLDTLGSILNFFHTTLAWLGVSQPQLDDLVDKALAAKALGAKVTGGGGGGCIIALPRRGQASVVEEALRTNGYGVFTVRLPVRGAEAWRVEI